MKFYSDLEKITFNLISAYGIEFKREIENLSEPLFRWLDFRLRYIDPVPRKIFASNRFPKNMSSAVGNGFQCIENIIRNGGDVNPYQSKGLIRFNDMSGKNRAKRTDLLWADWGIHHLHITDMPVTDSDYFSDRKCSNGESWILFCIFVGDTVGFIDVRRHEDESLFADQGLIRIVKESWPEYMEQFKLRGILPGQEGLTSNEISTLRKNGICSPACIDGDIYMGPGMGITSASTPMRVTDKAHRILDWIDQLATLADDENGQIKTEIKKLGVKEPLFELSLTPQGLAIFEEKSNVAFTVSKKAKNETDTYFAEMENLILPDWALQSLLADKRAG